MSSKAPFFCFYFFFSLNLPIFLALPDPDPAKIQPFLPTPSPPATIPAFPEQSDIAGCPLDLPDQLFQNIKSACATTKNSFPGTEQQPPHFSRCCPVLAAWLYAAYSDTALGKAGKVPPAAVTSTSQYDMPLLPDDSETCVNDLEMAMRERGIELVKPNETCDVVYCYCGIRLHPLSCPDAFYANEKGKLVGDESVKRLERDCLSSGTNANGFPGLGGCSKCLKSLHLLNGEKIWNSSKSEDRASKMRNKDCQLMGLTWLLEKNRRAYIHTVSAVLRAIMMSTDGSYPQSCTLSSDGMPLAVDSSEISNHSSANTPRLSVYLCIISLCLLNMRISVSLRIHPF